MTRDTSPTPEDAATPAAQASRQAWLALMAGADDNTLARIADPLVRDQHWTWLRQPERGLVMLRGRMGNTGNRFNVGEATVTRCALRVDGHEEALGIGYVMGRNTSRATTVAVLDALMQSPRFPQADRARLLADLADASRQRRQQRAARSDATRVHFHTLQSEAA